ncbi:MAG: hypothetical protein EXS28_00215 [Pedosphaera sp.]|nr:hypothetical protein [Pedosphaera sp.]
MKKLLFLAAGLALALPLPAQDQPKKRPERPPQGKGAPDKAAPGKGAPGSVRGDRSAQLVEQLKLSPEQAEKVKAIFAEQSEKMRGLFQNQGGTREERQEKMTAMRKAMDEKLADILTAEQAKKYKELSATNPSGGFGGGRPGGGGFGGGGLAGLDLTPEQQKKVQDLRTELFGKLRELPEAERADKYRAANEEFQKKLEGILTDEQKKKLKELRANPATPNPTRRRPEADPKKS